MAKPLPILLATLLLITVVYFSTPTNKKSGTETAVSYTHLRAHETVLDLVCRLLLEKKKNNHAHTEFQVYHNK